MKEDSKSAFICLCHMYCPYSSCAGILQPEVEFNTSNYSDMHAACAYGVRVTVLVHLELAVQSTKVPRDSILITEK